jgi:dihydroorotase
MALREALADGTIDIVATDHAPHPVEAKECEWSAAAFGMVGLESALAVLQTTMVETGLIGWADVARVLSKTPARIGLLASQGLDIVAGSSANIVLVDPSITRVFGTDHLAGRSHNTPFGGIQLSGAVSTTLHNGYATLLNGQLVEADVVAQAAEAVRRG